MTTFGLVNPLPRALSHYERETIETSRRIGLDLTSRPYVAVEGLEGAVAKLSALSRAMRAPRISGVDDVTLVLWPALGLLEPALWNGSDSTPVIVVHDPEPLRSQVGFGRLSRMIAARSWGSRAVIVSHSKEASAVLGRVLPRNRVISVDHPVLTHQQQHQRVPGLVLVAGQYKPVRDTDLLARLGPALRSRGYTPLIAGSGWPEVPGWDIDRRFVPEEELERLLGAAEVVLLPYRKYFQSGITLRALEMGTVTVGARSSFAESVFGADSPLILEPGASADAWLEVIQAGAGADSARDAFDRYQAGSDESWRHLFAAASDISRFERT